MGTLVDMTWSRRRAVIVAIQATALAGLTARGVRAQPATPEGERGAVPPQAPPGMSPTGPASGIVADLLALAPEIPAGSEPSTQIAQFADVAGQLAAVGVQQPTTTEDPAMSEWIDAVRWLPIPDPAYSNGLEPEFPELLGFDLLQIDQGLEVGQPPDTITFLRGRFDEEALRTAWANGGHQPVDVDGHQVHSLAEGPAIDPRNPVNRIALARYNNVTLLPDGTLVYASTLDLMRSVVSVMNGGAPSLAEHPAVAPLLSTVDEPLVGAIIVDGAVLDHTALFFGSSSAQELMEQVERELAQTGEMPPASLALFGVTPGGPLPDSENEPQSTAPADGSREDPPVGGVPAFFVIRLLMQDAGAAETAAETIPQRIATLSSLVTEQPYAEMVTVRRVEALSDPPAVALDLDFVAGEVLPTFWLRAVSQRDLLYLAY